MTRGQFWVWWALSATAYMYVFFGAIFLAFPINNDEFDGLSRFGETIASVLGIPGKWLLPNNDSAIYLPMIALCFIVNVACWGLLLPLTRIGLRRVVRRADPVAR
jgi:hypothetical protein